MVVAIFTFTFFFRFFLDVGQKESEELAQAGKGLLNLGP